MGASTNVTCPTCSFEAGIRAGIGEEPRLPEYANRATECLRLECPDHGDKPWPAWVTDLDAEMPPA
jgi:predicted hydrocarbon binding protein